MVDEHKVPFRKRSNGRGHAPTNPLLGEGKVCERLRRFGATHAGGGIRNVSSSRTLQT
jgi:hypothetical protein